MVAEVAIAPIATRGSRRRDRDLTPPVGKEPQASSCGNTTLQPAWLLFPLLAFVTLNMKIFEVCLLHGVERWDLVLAKPG